MMLLLLGVGCRRGGKGTVVIGMKSEVFSELSELSEITPSLAHLSEALEFRVFLYFPSLARLTHRPRACILIIFTALTPPIID